jgi:hypothetical protein
LAQYFAGSDKSQAIGKRGCDGRLSMCRTVKTALWEQREVMEAAAERTSLARLSLVMIRSAGCVPVAVKAKR